MVYYMDAVVGSMVEALTAKQMWDDTLWFFQSGALTNSSALLLVAAAAAVRCWSQLVLAAATAAAIRLFFVTFVTAAAVAAGVFECVTIGRRQRRAVVHRQRPHRQQLPPEGTPHARAVDGSRFLSALQPEGTGTRQLAAPLARHWAEGSMLGSTDG